MKRKQKMLTKLKCLLGFHKMIQLNTVEYKGVTCNVSVCENCKELSIQFVNNDGFFPYVDLLLKVFDNTPTKYLDVSREFKVFEGTRYYINGFVLLESNVGYWLDGKRISYDTGFRIKHYLDYLITKKEVYDREHVVEEVVNNFAGLIGVTTNKYDVDTLAGLLRVIPIKYIQICSMCRGCMYDKYMYPALSVNGVDILYSGNREVVYINNHKMPYEYLHTILDAIKYVHEKCENETIKNVMKG